MSADFLHLYNSEVLDGSILKPAILCRRPLGRWPGQARASGRAGAIRTGAYIYINIYVYIYIYTYIYIHIMNILGLIDIPPPQMIMGNLSLPDLLINPTYIYIYTPRTHNVNVSRAKTSDALRSGHGDVQGPNLKAMVRVLRAFLPCVCVFFSGAAGRPFFFWEVAGDLVRTH